MAFFGFYLMDGERKFKSIGYKKIENIFKILLNLLILAAIIYILIKEKAVIFQIFNKLFLFAFLCEFIILFFISIRIFFLSRALREKISLKDIYLTTITTKFYNLFLPTLLTEGIRGIKYYLAGVNDKYNVFFLVLLDRVIGFITFSIIFLLSLFLKKPSYADRNLMFFFIVFLIASILFLFNVDKIRAKVKFMDSSRDLSKKNLLNAIKMSFIAQFIIMLKYFFIFRFLIDLSYDFITTLYICSGSHLSQIIPFSTGLFSVKDGFLFYIINKQQGEYIKALSLILVLGVIEILIGITGGIVELSCHAREQLKKIDDK